MALIQYLHTKDHMCDWELEQVFRDAYSSYLERLTARGIGAKDVSDLLPLLAKVDDPALHRKAAALFGQRYVQPTRNLSPSKPNGKIRIAYVSSDLNEHPVAYQSAEVFELHDRSKFEIFAFSYGRTDEETEFTKRLTSAFEYFCDVSSLSDTEVADKIQELGIHIAVDMNGYTAIARNGILASRPAPIQISYLGYPGTMAVPFIDYFIADQIIIPENERQGYAENISYLPNCYLPQDRKRSIATHRPRRTDVGLPSAGFIFCCFNSAYKITPHQFHSWCDILKAVPESVLWLAEGNRWSAENLRKEAGVRGVESNKLFFAQKLTTISIEDHLAHLSLADLFLDCYPYSAHATGCDSLWAGVPIVTKAGRSIASRAAASLLTAVQLPELITETDEDYKTVAVQLASDVEKMNDVRSRLEHTITSAPLFNTPNCGS